MILIDSMSHPLKPGLRAVLTSVTLGVWVELASVPGLPASELPLSSGRALVLSDLAQALQRRAGTVPVLKEHAA